MIVNEWGHWIWEIWGIWDLRLISLTSILTVEGMSSNNMSTTNNSTNPNDSNISNQVNQLLIVSATPQEIHKRLEELILRKKALEDDLKAQEKQIFDLETAYIGESQFKP